MTKMELELKQALHLYQRTGGKKNRKNQAEKMLSFCRDIQRHDPKLKSIGQIGRKHVSGFWYRKDRLAPSTKLAYYYGICYLWCKIIKRSSVPPHYDKAI